MSRILGLVLECDAGGPDELVFRCLVRRLDPSIEVKPTCLGTKRAVLDRGAEAAQQLVEASGCGLVLIVWDLKPLSEGPPLAKTCMDEANELREKLKSLPPATQQKIRLLCITYELETWFLADERVIRGFLSTAERAFKYKVPNKLETKGKDPKAILNGCVKAAPGKQQRYTDYCEAIQLAQLIPDTSRVRAIKSFKRFATLLTGKGDADFQHCGKVCDDLAYQAFKMGR